MNWYTAVSKDITQVPAAIAHYESELASAKFECKVSGSIEKASAALPGIVEQRFNQLQELEAILELLNIEMKALRNGHFRKYLENYNRTLSSRDCEKFAEGESDVVEFAKLINEFALIRNQYLGIIKAIDTKQWQLTNITKLRCAGLDDASI
jgi:hypothetical protein